MYLMLGKGICEIGRSIRRNPIMSTMALDNPVIRQMILSVARWAAEEALGAASQRPLSWPDIPGEYGGAFVTFWSGARLRGCVGRFEHTTNLSEMVAEVTRATMSDERFANDPITARELSLLTIEVSVLSDPMETNDPKSLIVGVHGLIVRRGTRSGCFLPKVAVEHGWSAEQFLSACCTMKAGLPADAWQSRDTTVYLFTAEVISESTNPGANCAAGGP